MEHVFNCMISKIAVFLNKDTQFSETQYLQMYYGLQIVSYNILVVAFILILAAVLQCFLSALLVFTMFAAFRIIAGGFHFNHMGKCLITTTAVIVGSGKLALYIAFSTPLTVILCVFLDIILLTYIPRGTEKNPYSGDFSKLQRKRLCILSAVATLLALCFPRIRSGILLAMCFAVIFLLPPLIHQWREKSAA